MGCLDLMNPWTLGQDNSASMRIRTCRPVCTAKYSILSKDVLELCIVLSPSSRLQHLQRRGKESFLHMACMQHGRYVFFLMWALTSAMVALLYFVLQVFAIRMHGNNGIRIVESFANAHTRSTWVDAERCSQIVPRGISGADGLALRVASSKCSSCCLSRPKEEDVGRSKRFISFEADGTIHAHFSFPT